MLNNLLFCLTIACMGFPCFCHSQGISTIEDKSSAAKVYKQVSDSVFTVYGVGKTGYALGSAVAIERHLLATNCHVALAGNYFKVKVNDVMKDGALSYYDQDKDLCLVSVMDANFVPVNIRPSSEIDIGENVYAIGNPEGYERTISKGIISNKQNISGKFLLQTDAPISHGSSGGGLFDENGNLIGITEESDSRGENLNFAIPSEIILTQIHTGMQSNIKPHQASLPPSSVSHESPAPGEMVYSNPALIGYYGNDKIGLFKWGATCIITITGHYSKSDYQDNESLAIWAPTLPNTLMVIPSTADINKATRYLFNFIVDKTADFQTTRSILIFDKNLLEMRYDNNLSEKYSVMYAVMNEDITKSLIDDDDFSIQFYQYRSQPGMTTVHFALDGFTEALSAYRRSCEK